MQPLKDRVLLVTDPTVEEVDVTIIKEDLEEAPPVHEGPGAESEVVEYAEPGETYRIIDQRGGWARIEIRDITGWVHGENLSEIKTMEMKEFEEIKEEEGEEEEAN